MKGIDFNRQADRYLSFRQVLIIFQKKWGKMEIQSSKSFFCCTTMCNLDFCFVNYLSSDYAYFESASLLPINQVFITQQYHVERLAATALQ